MASTKAIEQTLLLQVDSFNHFCKLLEATVQSRCVDVKQIQNLFLGTRSAFKNFEWAAEYFEPATSRAVNGAPVREVETSGQLVEPAGLQVIESLLFPSYDTSRKPELVRQLNLLQEGCNKYKIHFTQIDIFDWQVFDAVKLEVFRIETLGISGFDNPLTLKSMTESAAGLKSIQKVLACYEDSVENLQAKFDIAARYLDSNTDFNSFNRAEFITGYCNPLTTSITDLENRLKIHIIRYNRLLNQDAKTLFDSNAYNVNAYSPDQSSFITKEKIALGKLLFSDPVLSGNGIRSCQSCHQPEKAFADGLVKNTAIKKNEVLKRNTPTLLNAAFQPAQFYDLRVNTLENQSLDVIQSSLEMHGSLKLTGSRLWEHKTYRQLFSTAFPKKDRTAIDTLEVMNALASYIRSLVSLNSRFDEYMRGKKKALTAGEISGFNLFMGKGKCATCHYMPLFNGTFPPRYLKTDAEVIGVPNSLHSNKIDGDPGRYDVIKIQSFRHAFKTPTIRNAARTAPYMHNGVFTSLQQVINFYNAGGGLGAGMRIENQTLPPDKLNLTQRERNDIIAFINCLNTE